MKNKLSIWPAIVIATLIIIDQQIKSVISHTYELSESKTFIKGLFNLTYIRNEGTAWGLFAGQRIIFVLVTIIILLLTIYEFYRLAVSKRFFPIRLVIILLISGAVGNMIDRIKYGYVIDYLDFQIINFPIFNFADILIVISIIMLLILFIFVYSSKELDTIMSLKPIEIDKNENSSEEDSE